MLSKWNFEIHAEFMAFHNGSKKRFKENQWKKRTLPTHLRTDPDNKNQKYALEISYTGIYQEHASKIEKIIENLFPEYKVETNDSNFNKIGMTLVAVFLVYSGSELVKGINLWKPKKSKFETS